MFTHILLHGSDAPTRQLPEGVSKAFIGFHSGWRYIILVLLVMAIVYAYQASKGKRPFAGAAKKLGMFTMIAADIQFLVGAVLYFFFLSRYTNMQMGKLKDQISAPEFRTMAVDHALGMFIALVLIHIGYSKAKKALDDSKAGKKQFTYYLIALILILLSIPWPFLSVHASRGWF